MGTTTGSVATAKPRFHSFVVGRLWSAVVSVRRIVTIAVDVHLLVYPSTAVSIFGAAEEVVLQAIRALSSIKEP